MTARAYRDEFSYSLNYRINWIKYIISHNLLSFKNLQIPIQ